MEGLGSFGLEPSIYESCPGLDRVQELLLESCVHLMSPPPSLDTTVHVERGRQTMS